MTLYDVIQVNRAVIKEMHGLNVRSGEDIFPIPSKDELVKMLQGQLGLPQGRDDFHREISPILSIDPELKARVLRENPDAIHLAGVEIPLIYEKNKVLAQIPENLLWNECFEGGIKIPSSRGVTLAHKYRTGYPAIEAGSFRDLRYAMDVLTMKERWFHEVEYPITHGSLYSITDIREKRQIKDFLQEVSLEGKYPENIRRGWVALDYEYGSWSWYYKIKILEDFEEAQKETLESLKRLMKEEIKSLELSEEQKQEILEKISPEIFEDLLNKARILHQQNLSEKEAKREVTAQIQELISSWDATYHGYQSNRALLSVCQRKISSFLSSTPTSRRCKELFKSFKRCMKSVSSSRMR